MAVGKRMNSGGSAGLTATKSAAANGLITTKAVDGTSRAASPRGGSGRVAAKLGGVRGRAASPVADGRRVMKVGRKGSRRRAGKHGEVNGRRNGKAVNGLDGGALNSARGIAGRFAHAVKDVEKWMADPAFPKRDEHGNFSAADLQGWFDAKDRELLQRALLLDRRAILKAVQDGKRLTGQQRAQAESFIRGNTDGEMPARATQAELAKILSNIFTKHPANKMAVSRGVKEGWLPQPNANQTINVGEAIAAWEAHFHLAASPAGAADGELDLFLKADQAEARLKIQEEERARFTFDLQRGIYIKKAEHKQAMAAFARAYHARVKQVIEHEGPRARAQFVKELGLPEVMVIRLADFDRETAIKAIDALEAFCADKTTKNRNEERNNDE